ncbi:MAG TPA: YicC/YloC family endoribonuclease [Beijerinckiaceae bacterium]|nr:YicC/YloC family endoribonuclease [Beijerinckiaceae bacterium]
MGLKSMTGFARLAGASPPFDWAWELKTVNAKGLDLRLRVPPGFDAIEPAARARLTARVARGTCYATLSVTRASATPEVRVNEAALAALLNAIKNLPIDIAVRPVSIDGLLAMRGIVDIIDGADNEAQIAATGAAAIEGLDAALDLLVEMRAREGEAIAATLGQRMARAAMLRQKAEDAPGRKPEAIRERLAAAVAALAQSSALLDPARLHQEALLLAAKADVREELDRLAAHIAAVENLLTKDEPVGRRLDFLAQELGREANTLCAKSNDAELTTIGMELRVEIEQFREQVQNIE